MQCKRRWQSGEESSRGEGDLLMSGGSDCGEGAWQRACRDMTGLDGARGGGEDRKVKLTARPSGTYGGGKTGTERPPDQSGPMDSRRKHGTKVLVRDRVRPGREAPGRLRRPAPLGRQGQRDSAEDPTGEEPGYGDLLERDRLTPNATCCLETEWTCWCCGTAWHKKIAKYG